VRTLDLTPLMTAMRNRPSEFEMQEPWLRHRPSGHSFLIQSGVLIRIEARCGCAELRAEPSQAAEFGRVLDAWIFGYWRPLQIGRAAERRAAEINRQFTAHFRPPSQLARVARRLADAWRAAVQELRRPEPQPLVIELPREEPQMMAAPPQSAPERPTVSA
jgi:hypothetical protein